MNLYFNGLTIGQNSINQMSLHIRGYPQISTTKRTTLSTPFFIFVNYLLKYSRYKSARHTSKNDGRGPVFRREDVRDL